LSFSAQVSKKGQTNNIYVVIKVCWYIKFKDNNSWKYDDSNSKLKVEREKKRKTRKNQAKGNNFGRNTGKSINMKLRGSLQFNN
jgi:hypothetical protein